MIAYLDLPSGISGDMFLGCLVDAGWPIEQLRATLARLSLPAEEYAIESSSVMRGPLRATLVNVIVHRTFHQRNLPDIQKILDASDLDRSVRDDALAVFTRLAQAEAKVHGTTFDQVHFHEVGAVDAIVDIVGVVAGLRALGIDKLFASPVPLGGGWVNAAHGQLPIPAPATLEILSAAHAPTRASPGEGELVTPTGAALLAQLATFNQPEMTLHRVASGAGQKQFAWPNIARLWLGELRQSAPIVQIDTNIDDMNPQLYPAIIERLLASGARDAWLTSVHMKKGRPGVVLSVLATTADEAAVCDLILRETTTLGVRVYPVLRHEARRDIRSVETRFGPVHVKLKWSGEELIGATPEFEDCARLSREHNVPVRAVSEAAQAAAHTAFLGAAGM